MVTNYYNSSNNYSTPIRRNEPKPYEEVPKKCEEPIISKPKLDKDKTLILGILAVLYLTNCHDKWLILALLYLAFG